MRKYLSLSTILLALSGTAWAQQNSPQAPLDCDAFAEQKSSRYILPFPARSAFPVINTTGHYVLGNGGVGLYAIDFGMPIGTPIVAARGGAVVAVRETFHDGNGVDLEENFVFIEHEDATIGRYFHLTHDGALVRPGDRVVQGDTLGLSGNTGQSGRPHLHFDVQRCGPNLPPHYNTLPCGQTLPISFRNTEQHRCGLAVGKTYSPDYSPARVGSQFAGFDCTKAPILTSTEPS